MKDFRNLTEAQRSWEKNMKPTRVIRKNTIVRGRGDVIFRTNATGIHYPGHWEVRKVGDTFRAYNRDTGVVLEAPIKYLYKVLDGACRDGRVIALAEAGMWDDDPFDDFSERPFNPTRGQLLGFD